MERLPPTQQHPVNILTAEYQFVGMLDIVGPPLEFINDVNRDGLILNNVRAAPLSTYDNLQPLNLPEVTVRRHEIIFLGFERPESGEAIRTLQRKEYVVVYTAVAALRVAVHLMAEAVVNDFLTTTRGALLPVTDASIHFFTPPRLPFPERTDLLMIGRDKIKFYHMV